MTLLSPRHEVGEFKKRYKWMALVVLVVFGILMTRMVQLQVFQHERWADEARENITKTVTLPATRGVIRDTDGRIVADNEPSYDVYITPQLLDPGDVERIGELMGLDRKQRADLRERIGEVPARRRTHQIEMFSDISRRQLASLETHSTSLPGVDVVASPERKYPFDTLGAHAIGYLNEIGAEELERREDQGYGAGDMIGRSGIERAWESYLRGQRGFYRVIVDAQGRLHERVSPERRDSPGVRRDPVPGRNLQLSLDMGLMKSLRRHFRGHPSGASVVVEADTGKVRALYSKPAYDPDEMSGGVTRKRLDELRGNPFHPLIDKTIYETYFPGSTFKPFSAIAALEDGSMDPSSHLHCPGFYELGKRRFHCTQAHGEVDMHEALTRSCNVYFYQLGQNTGIDRLARCAHEFGLGSPTGIGINSESRGFIATRDWYVEQWGSPYRLGFTLNASIGQGNTRVTLLQLAMAYGAIVNGGKLYVPLLVEQVSAPDGAVLEEFGPRVRREVEVEQAHLDLVMGALRDVVNHPEGTAYDARVRGGARIAGKTGTAEVAYTEKKKAEEREREWYYRRDHAWFVGLAPADDPEIVAVVVVEHGGSGGKTAAPIGIQVLEKYMSGHGGKGRKTARAGGSEDDPVLASAEER